MKIKRMHNTALFLSSTMLLLLVCSGANGADSVPTISTNTSTVPSFSTFPNGRSKPSSVATKPKSDHVREDYFVSSDTVIIGCTSGMAAGILVGSVPVAGAVMSGIGVPESITLLVNLAGMGCGVGAVSGAVAILTAWMLAPD